MNTIKPALLVEQKQAIAYFKIRGSVFLRYLRENKIKVYRGHFIPRDSIDGFNAWNERRIAKRKEQMQEVGRKVGKLRSKRIPL